MAPAGCAVDRGATEEGRAYGEEGRPRILGPLEAVPTAAADDNKGRRRSTRLHETSYPGTLVVWAQIGRQATPKSRRGSTVAPPAPVRATFGSGVRDRKGRSATLSRVPSLGTSRARGTAGESGPTRPRAPSVAVFQGTETRRSGDHLAKGASERIGLKGASVVRGAASGAS